MSSRCLCHGKFLPMSSSGLGLVQAALLGVRVPRQGVNTLVTAGDHPRQDVTPCSISRAGILLTEHRLPSHPQHSLARRRSHTARIQHTGDPSGQVRPTPREDPGQGILPRQDTTSCHCLLTQPPKDPAQLLRQDGTQSLDPVFQKQPGPASSLQRVLEVSPLQHSSDSIPVRTHANGPALPSASHGTSKAPPGRTGPASLPTADPSRSHAPSGCPRPGRTGHKSHPPHPGMGFSWPGRESLFRQEKTNSPQHPGQDEIPSSRSPAGRTCSHLCRRSRLPPKHA